MPQQAQQQKTQQQKRPRKVTEYGQQLAEKQKVRNSYGLREAQFRRYYAVAARFSGQTGAVLLQNLECRLDNVLFRSGIAKTRAQARQLVSHRHFLYNGKRVNIPSIAVKVGDIIKPHKSGPVELNPDAQEVSWLKTDKKTGTITIASLPASSDLPIEFDTQKIIEFYSR